MSEDNLDEFVGATLLGLRVIDTDGKTASEIKPDEDYRDDDFDDSDGRFDNAMFVNIETDRGDSPIHCVQQSQWLLRAYGPGSQSATNLSRNTIRGVKYAHLKLLRLPR